MFKVGDKVKVINPNFEYFGCEGIIKDVDVADSDSMVDFGEGCSWCRNENLERVDDMNISERLSEVIKENQNLKQQLSEQNIKLNKIRADINRELRHKHGVSDEEFREAVDFWLKSSSSLIAEVWGEDYKNSPMSVMCSMSLSEFVNKYKEYKNKKDNEIKVGDVVKGSSGMECIVTRIPSITNELMYVLYRDGSGSEASTELYIKTDKHYDSIDEFMNS